MVTHFSGDECVTQMLPILHAEDMDVAKPP